MKVIQLVPRVLGDYLVALCDDGSMWYTRNFESWGTVRQPVPARTRDDVRKALSGPEAGK